MTVHQTFAAEPRVREFVFEDVCKLDLIDAFVKLFFDENSRFIILIARRIGDAAFDVGAVFDNRFIGQKNSHGWRKFKQMQKVVGLLL